MVRKGKGSGEGGQGKGLVVGGLGAEGRAKVVRGGVGSADIYFFYTGKRTPPYYDEESTKGPFNNVKEVHNLTGVCAEDTRTSFCSVHSYVPALVPRSPLLDLNVSREMLIAAYMQGEDGHAE